MIHPAVGGTLPWNGTEVGGNSEPPLFQVHFTIPWDPVDNAWHPNWPIPEARTYLRNDLDKLTRYLKYGGYISAGLLAAATYYIAPKAFDFIQAGYRETVGYKRNEPERDNWRPREEPENLNRRRIGDESLALPAPEEKMASYEMNDDEPWAAGWRNAPRNYIGRAHGPYNNIGTGAGGPYIRNRIKKAKKKRTPNMYGPPQTTRVSAAGQLVGTINTCVYHEYELVSVTEFEAMVNSYYSIGMNDANTTARVENITNRTAFPSAAKVRLISAKQVFKFRNNDTLPVDFVAYWLIAKVDTSNTPEAALVSGIDDRAGSDAGWELEPWFYPRHSKSFREGFNTVKTHRFRIAPGGEYTLVHEMGSWYYDADMNDSYVEAYKRGMSRWMLLRQMGVISHDDADETLVGYAASEVDLIREKTIKFQHVHAPIIARDTYTDGYDAITDPVIAHVPLDFDIGIDGVND